MGDLLASCGCCCCLAGWSGQREVEELRGVVIESPSRQESEGLVLEVVSGTAYA